MIVEGNGGPVDGQLDRRRTRTMRRHLHSEHRTLSHIDLVGHPVTCGEFHDELVGGSASSSVVDVLESKFVWCGPAPEALCVALPTLKRGPGDPRSRLRLLHHERSWLSLVGRLRDAVGENSFVEKLTPSPEFDGVALVERLVSDLDSLGEQVVLVIDDLHELTSADALAQLDLLLARLPRVLKLVLVTRRDPHLQLARLRLAGDLTEIRAADLRFTPVFPAFPESPHVGDDPVE